MLTRLTLIGTLLLLPALILAQGTGKVKGTVTDQASNEVLIGASVSIEGTSLGAATDIDGNYVIQNVPAGVHTVRSSYVGYQVVSVSNIRVNSGLDRRDCRRRAQTQHGMLPSVGGETQK